MEEIKYFISISLFFSHKFLNQNESPFMSSNILYNILYIFFYLNKTSIKRHKKIYKTDDLVSQ